MQKSIIVDLDGVLANNHHRLHFISGPNKDFKIYQQYLIYDEPNEWCLSILKNLKNIHIIFVTSRNESFRDLTIEWFKLFGVDKLDYSLHMRKDGDYRKHTDVKEEIYEYKIKNNYEIVFAIDNDIAMCNIYEKNGITALCCE